MAILAFQKPDKVIMIDSDHKIGKFEFRPLEPGYSITIGNALRRILLSSLEGFAITSVKIEGVEHEFSTIVGIVEDVSEIILQLKQIRFKRVNTDIEEEEISMSVTNQEKFVARDLVKALNNFEILNPELLICNMDKNAKINVTITIKKGRGYVPSEENKNVEGEEKIGLIPIDSIFTPIRNVKYSVENYRVEQKTDYEKLLIELETDGSISPKDALKEAAKILIHHFMLFSDEKIQLEEQDKHTSDEFNEDVLHMRQLLNTKLVDMDLSVRALNCLKAAEIETLGELVSYNHNDLLKFRNFGKKSLIELEDLLNLKQLTFGMDVTKYKLNK